MRRVVIRDVSVRPSSPTQMKIGGDLVQRERGASMGETSGWDKHVAEQKISALGGDVGQRWSAGGSVGSGMPEGEAGKM